MLIANESNWRTDDLEALLELVKADPGYKENYRVYDNTLLLFTTSCAKATKPRFTEEVVEPPPACYERKKHKWEDTIVVKIRSAKKLKLDVLDRIAHIGPDYEQHMSGDDVVKVARCIGVAVGSYRSEYLSYEWARQKSLRTRSKITRSDLARDREIRALESKRRNTQYRMERSLRKIDQQIDKVRKG